MGPIDGPETAVTSCQPKLRNTPKNGRPQDIKLILPGSLLDLVRLFGKESGSVSDNSMIKTVLNET
jgi:hypothetical protein